MEIKQISQECIDIFWTPQVKGWIQKVVEQTGGRHTLQTTYRLLKEGVMTMFLVLHGKKISGVIVTQVMQYPAKKTLAFLFIGGEKIIGQLKKVEDYFKKYAKSKNLDTVECCGRKGWLRVSKQQKQTMKITGYAYEFLA